MDRIVLYKMKSTIVLLAIFPYLLRIAIVNSVPVNTYHRLKDSSACISLGRCDLNNSFKAFFADEPSVDGSKVRQLSHDYFKWRLHIDPEYSTTIGIYELDDQLNSYSQEQFLTIKHNCEEYLQRAQSCDETNLSPEDKFKLEMIIDQLTTFINGYPFKGYVFPLTYLDGLHLSLPTLVQLMQYNCENDYEKLLRRLKKIPQQINEIISVMKLGIAEGFVFHEVSIKDVPKQISRLLVSPIESVFYIPFKNSSRKYVQKQALLVVQEKVLPAFADLKRFIENEYLNNVRPKIGASSLPNGPKFYQQCLDFHLSTHMTPEEVHNMGIQEVERIETNIEKIKNQMGFQGSLQEFFVTLRQNSSFFYENENDLLEGYKNLVNNVIRPKLSEYFLFLPPLKMDILKVPDVLSNSPTAFHTKRSFDGKHLGVFWVNTHFLNQRPKYEMPSLSLHEAEPGHELQGVVALEQPDLMRFQQFVNDAFFHSVPSTFSMYTAFNEGWALYSEYLGEEMGLYKTPFDLLGRYSQEIFRACRLVVDTGIHAFNWTVDTAVEYMLTHTAASSKNIENEVKRYITWPGQACAYKIGEMKIKKLREKAETTLGSLFDLRKFHDACLKHGNVPLTLLEKTVEDYIIKEVVSGSSKRRG